jgi:cobalamin biosynthesis Mg chelatase CobN
MEKFELSPVELMQALGWKKSKVYYWISSGKFETVERVDGQKVVLSADDMNRLKNSNNSEKVETVVENSNNSEEVLKNLEDNVTKNYKNVSKSLNSEAFELFNKSLETIERIHQTALNNFGYTTKLLTDSKSEVQEENLKLSAEVKTVQARLEKSQKVHFWKNIIIFVLLLVLICLTGYVLISSKISTTEQNSATDSQVQDLK